MGKKLIITEKPSVARDFAHVLGVSGNKNGYIENEKYVISWCYGHLVTMSYPDQYDLKYEKWRLEDLPFLPETYRYEVVKSAEEQYKVVHTLLHREDVDTVYWAGDSGKEGQTIEENIRNYGGVREGMTELRVWIDSQTDEEIRRGIEEAKPMSEYARLGKSGIMRTIEDYSLGINFSRVLSIKYGKMLNDAAATSEYTAIAIGRVMTCVLGMVVNREREIRNFKETPFYRIVGRFTDAGIQAEWKATQDSKYFESPKLYKENGFKKEEDALTLKNEISSGRAVVENIEKGTSKKRAPLLFNLAELQSECSKIFKISPANTLQIAQDLYERKLTTYPRTDARVLTTAIAKQITKNLYGIKNYEPVAKFVNEIIEQKKYVNLEKTSYTDDSKVTDHYAIIPTGQINGLEKLDHLHKAVYELITKRFLAIFYPPAEFVNVKLQIKVLSEEFFASAKVLKNPGYMQVTGVLAPKDDDSENTEPNNKEALLALTDTIHKGDELTVGGYEIKEGKTSPPKRYTSGNLILAMENAGNLIEDEELREQIKKSGIGTSATRGEILDKLVRIRYLNQNSKTQIITPENLGEMIYEVVRLSVPSLLNPEMTASWEKGLEGIVNGSVDDVEYRQKLEAFIRTETNKMIGTDLRGEIAKCIHPFTTNQSRGAATRRLLGIQCPACGGELSTTAFGYGCSNYYDEEIKCKFSVGQIAGVTLTEQDFRNLITTGTSGVIKGFKSKNKKSFSAKLLLQKDENGQYGVSFDFDGVEPDYLEDVVCPDCGGKLIIKASGFGCSNYQADNPESCRFFIGKIAQKTITKAQVIELLTEHRTKTIRGFKSKNGNRFDACLVLQKNEHGKSVIGFDFENVEAKVIKGVACPLCGAEIVKTSFGYGCSNYNREDKENSCRFSIGELASVTLNESQLKELLNNGITSPVKGFKSKNGNSFEARVALAKNEEGIVTGCKFVFDDPDVVLEDVKCPKCQGRIIKSRFGYRCQNNKKDTDDCDFFVGQIASVMLEVEQFKTLLTTGKTDKLSGFISKSGNPFDAVLKLDENKNVVFDFS